MSRYIAIAIISLSRMVAQTFSADMQIKVWSGRVCAFAIFVQFVFPISYVAAFMVDDPQLSLMVHDNAVFVGWGNLELHVSAVQFSFLIDSNTANNIIDNPLYSQ
ncbi:unnamed protein product [Anisakis simplex]|uniref:G_PROTEIN_RECEP_F1_2 domain-containing protein n=1 Tax=Anisakis simplex TaxID=6269 RepID=A0A0M3KKL1_ANISI|nr:unnamed protein product [Anisakis simplex]